MTRPVEVERCHHEHTTSFTGARLGRPAVPFAKWERCIAEPPSHVTVWPADDEFVCIVRTVSEWREAIDQAERWDAA